jgi:hypothetical protein
MEEPSSALWPLFLYAMKSPATREKYIGRLGKCLDYLGLEGATVEEKIRRFSEKGSENAGWVFNSILLFMQMQRERYRLVIAEYEEHIIDDRPYDNISEKKGRRLVFVEHVELD